MIPIILNLKTMNKLLALLYYYTLLLLGFSATSWIIYARFIRERIPKDIPMFMTEYRFIILFYICCIYFIVVISLLFYKSKEPNFIFKTLLEIVYTPLITLDHLIKYNRYVKPYYYKFIYKFLILLEKLDETQLLLVNFLFQILPRVFLVTFLVIDTFYFHKLDILYKFILIGVIPFIHRYIKYSFKDIKDHYIQHLSGTYKQIMMWDLAYNDPEIDWESTEENKYHREEISIKEYVEFRTKQLMYGYPETNYDAIPGAYEHIYDSYYKKYDINEEINLTENDYSIIRQEYHTIMPTLLQFNIFIETYSQVGSEPLIKWSKAIIFTLYFTCWFYILVISYYNNPIELIYCKYYFFNVLSYFEIMNDIFMPYCGRSLIPGAVTIENMRWLLNKIYITIKNKL